MARELIGEIPVDAGLCWIGDPCYILHRPKKELDKDLGESWREFCKILDGADTKQFQSGVVASTGHGDGRYPVYATIERGIIIKLEVIFQAGEDDEDEY